MPLNLTKRYNELLELASLSNPNRTKSLLAIFQRDIVNNSLFHFRKKPINPTPKDGIATLDTLFHHLTTEITDEATRKREFDIHRSMRLHWVRFHLEEKNPNNILVFSVAERQGNRTYIYDRLENYVIILEPLRKTEEYYLLTAYHIRGKDLARNKMEQKYKRKLNEIL